MLDFIGIHFLFSFPVDNFVDILSPAPPNPHKSRLFLDCTIFRQFFKTFINQQLTNAIALIAINFSFAQTAPAIS